MSLLLRQRSTAYRLREQSTVVAESFGPLHGKLTLLEWGSITKTVTATITRNLSQCGIIDLNAPVSHYLSDSGLPEQVDVASLVTHTSGLGRLPSDILASWAERKNPYAKYSNHYFDERVIPRLSDELKGEYGHYVYSNLGYAVLTRILETVSKKSWWQLGRELIFTPWGISDVTTNHVDHPTARDPARIADLRTWTGNTRTTWSDAGPFIGAGGLLGTFDSLESYAIAARTHAGSEAIYGWVQSPSLWWHNGHTRDHGSFLGISASGSKVITVHTLGRRIGTADRIAMRLRNH